jgi:endoglucanase
VAKNYFNNTAITRYFVILLIIVSSNIAKSNPKPVIDRSQLFKRAQSLDNGISISWLEQTWNPNMLDSNAVKSTDFALLKKLGFTTIRLPVAFSYFQSRNIPVKVVLTHIDEILKQCKIYGFKLVLDYHGGKLNDTNYVAETTKITATWVFLAKKYKHEDPNFLFFELYNEPPHMDPQIWKDAAYNMVTAIRKIDNQRTLIIGASNYNSIYELSRFVRLSDENIIYTFHFYEPFLFTHQGAAWAGDQESTTGVTFPYNGENFPIINPKAKNTDGEKNYKEYPIDGNEQSLKDKLQIIKNWSLKYDVPIICGEYGVYNKYADLDSRCRYIKAMRNTLKMLNIPGMLWEYNSSFSIFDGKPSVKNLPPCMKDAIGYTAVK